MQFQLHNDLYFVDDIGNNQLHKRKKSGAEFRRAKKTRENENKQLSSFTTNYFNVRQNGNKCNSASWTKFVDAPEEDHDKFDQSCAVMEHVGTRALFDSLITKLNVQPCSKNDA